MQHDRVSSFFETITPEILSPADYTDWEAIEAKVTTLRREIALLNSLDKKNAVTDLADLLHTSPKILLVLQLLVAHTPQKIFFNDPTKYIDFTIDLGVMAKDQQRAKQIAEIFVEMGLLQFLQRVRSIEDMVRGVFIGLEPNTRKNRRGTKLELLLNDLVASTVTNLNRDFEGPLSFERQMYADLLHERKKVDYLILKDGKPAVAIEVNFYSTSGSKPSEVLGRAYPDVQEHLRQKGIGFIVITDGNGWNDMKPVIRTAFDKLNHVMNIKQAQGGELENVVREILSAPESSALQPAA